MSRRTIIFFALVVPAACLAGLAAVAVMIWLLRNFDQVSAALVGAGVPDTAAGLLIALAMLITFALGIILLVGIINVSWRRMFPEAGGPPA